MLRRHVVVPLHVFGDLNQVHEDVGGWAADGALVIDLLLDLGLYLAVEPLVLAELEEVTLGHVTAHAWHLDAPVTDAAGHPGVINY